MIKIYKHNLDDPNIHVCKKIEEDSWIRLVHPTDEEIEKVAKGVGIPKSIISQVLVEKELPRVKQIP